MAASASQHLLQPPVSQPSRPSEPARTPVDPEPRVRDLDPASQLRRRPLAPIDLPSGTSIAAGPAVDPIVGLQHLDPASQLRRRSEPAVDLSSGTPVAQPPEPALSELRDPTTRTTLRAGLSLSRANVVTANHV